MSKCYSVGVDPDFAIKEEIQCDLRLFRMTSDDFFARAMPLADLASGFDLMFIDGMHLFEYALRDFMNCEKHSAPGAVVVVDDIYPRNAAEALRDKQQRPENVKAWTGDVWKLLAVLHKYRPDLQLIPIDCMPTGLLIVSNLDPSSNVLREHYDEIIRAPDNAADRAPPPEVLTRHNALQPAAAFRQVVAIRRAEDSEWVSAAGRRSISVATLANRKTRQNRPG